MSTLAAGATGERSGKSRFQPEGIKSTEFSNERMRKAERKAERVPRAVVGTDLAAGGLLSGPRIQNCDQRGSPAWGSGVPNTCSARQPLQC